MLSFLKIRADISLEGDGELAYLEVFSMYGKVEKISSHEVLPEVLLISKDDFLSDVCKLSYIGFLCDEPLYDLDTILIKLSFIQEVWINHIETYEDSEKFKNTIGVHIPFMAMAEICSNSKAELILSKNAKCSCRSLEFSTSAKKNSSMPHVHSFHKYKAKFFPRLVRFIINYVNPNLKTNSSGELIILDPYVGSGTTLVEASLLGFNSIGIDIDPLSCLISQTKVNALSSTYTDDNYGPLFEIEKTETRKIYELPTSIRKKFYRTNNLEDLEKHEFIINGWRNQVSLAKGSKKDIYKIALSDALTRKFNIRMMGTGVPRFALEVSNFDISKMVHNNLINYEKSTILIKKLIINYNLNLGSAIIINDNALSMNIPESSISLIITSPPYLPAASGRESYLIGKEISLTALDIHESESKEMKFIEENSVGGMKVKIKEVEDIVLPEEVYSLHNWLLNDQLRSIKATPCLEYYKDLHVSLLECYRVLISGGFAVFVVGKESVFYKSSTREVLYRVDCANIFLKIAKNIGFEIHKVIDLELDKKNKNARPRSLDAYYETIIFLQK
jgi:DNA modification methylase